ncbi:MAG: PQQ-binding-like beta-propeller repeat protein [Fuerstiella sp.]|nr:PQQ-binding-like beta-propeller repeat protein [Fuerstiella sp.]
MKYLAIVLVVFGWQVNFRCGADDWPQFRGALGNSHLPINQHPVEWGSTKNIAWKTEMPGGGWASPVVSDDRIYVTTAVGKDLQPRGFSDGVASMGRFFGNSGKSIGKISYEVHCLRLSNGERLWKKQIIEAIPPHRVHPSNTYATETPVAADNRVYAYFATIGIVLCIDKDGAELWRRDVGAYATSSSFGTGSSLAFDGGRIFLQCDNQEKSFLLAINAEDGKDIWRVERSGRTCWSSPFVWRNHVRNELVVCGSGDVTGYGLDSGELLWRLTGIDGTFSASPASDDNRVYVGNSGPGRSGPLVALNAGATGQFEVSSPKSETGIAWVQQNSGPGLASPVSDGELVYVTGRGILNVYEAASGERVYRTRLKGSSSVAASPWIAGKTLYVLDESGHTNKIQTGAEFELMGTNIVDGLFWSTPSVAANSLLLRSSDSLYCVREESSGN